VAANTTAVAQSTTLTIAGQTFTVTEAAATCSFSLSSGSQSFPGAGGSASVAVTATPGCSWTATSSATWVTVVTGAAGTGNGSDNYTVAANPTPPARSATLLIGGQSFTVTQSAPGCVVTLSPLSQTFSAAGGTGTIDVSANNGCSWTASSSASWLSVIIGGVGTGDGTISFSVIVNTTASARNATITVGGNVFTVNQAAACSFVVSPLTLTPAAAGSSGTLAITTQAGCTWTTATTVSWITVTGSGTGSGTASYTVAPNTTSSSRLGTLAVAGKNVVFTQGAPSAPVAPTAPGNLHLVGG
jgi:hypothetical protein